MNNKEQTPKNILLDKSGYSIKKDSIIKESVNRKAKPEDYFYYKNFQILKVGQTRQVLSKSNSSEIVVVKSKSDGKKYAMKIIQKKNVSSINLLKQEIDLHLSLLNENIIKLYSYSETNDFYYLLMEYASKGSIQKEINNKITLKEDESKKYFAQIVNAIVYLHSRGYGHRNIKPENILIDCNNNIKLCGFSGCLNLDNSHRKISLNGKCEYMAPEIIEGGKYSRSVDIWALGILLYELLHGFSPFRIIEKKENIKEYYQIYQNIINADELIISNSVSDEAANLIKSK